MGARADEMMTPDDINATEGTGDTEQIREEIEQTRAELSDTINAIQAKLDPEVLKEQAMDTVEQARERVMETVRESTHHAIDTAREATIGRAEDFVYDAGDTVKGVGMTVVETIRENPIPAALAALGIGWLLMEGRNTRSSYTPSSRSRSYGYQGQGGQYRGGREDYYQGGRDYGYSNDRGYAQGGGGYRYEGRQDWDQDQGRMAGARERVSNVASNVTGAASGAVDTVQDTVGQVANTAQDAAGRAVDTVQNVASGAVDRVEDLGSEVQYRARRAGTRLEDLMEENPLAVGAIALAVGAAIGMAVPTTQREQQLMGESRDKLFDKAQEATSQALQKAKVVADETRDAIRTELDEQGIVDQVKEAARNVVDSAKQVATEAQTTVKDEAQSQGLTGSGGSSSSGSGS